MTCKKCGAEIMDDANFCLKCGEAVEHPADIPEPEEIANQPGDNVEEGQDNPELIFHKGTQLGRITYKKIDTRVEITETGLQIEKKTKKIFRKEKTEERFIPFPQIVSARVHTVLDYWDTLYGLAFVAVGVLFNLWALLPAVICFWCGYGKKVEFLLRSGEKYSFPYQFGKKKSSILVGLCNKAASRQTVTNDTGGNGIANTPAFEPNGGNATFQEPTSKKIGKILKIAIGLIFAVALLFVVIISNRHVEKNDYITAVKEHKPFLDSIDLDYTYEEVFERYISDATWSSQETITGADVIIQDTAAGLDEKIAITIEVTTSSVVSVADPKLVELGDETLSDEDEVTSFLLVLFQAYDAGYKDFTDILRDEMFSDSEQQEANIETVQNGYLGEYTDITVKDLLWAHYKMTLYDEETWDSGTTDDGKEIVQVTYHDVDGDFEDVNIQFTMLGDEVFKITAFVDPISTIEKSTDLLITLNNFYLEQYIIQHSDELGTVDDFERELSLVKRLEAISGSAVQYGASAEYSGDRSKLCTLNGDLPLDVNAAMLLDSAGLLDMDHYYATPSPVPTQEPTPTHEPPATNDLAQYYGFYNSKDVGLFWVTLDKGSDDDSFYVYIEYETMMNKNDVHADIKPDGETYMTFYADSMTGSDGIIKDMNSIEGAVSLEILDDGTLHMVLYTSQRKQDTPFDVILEPWER